jgi:hypothetical protein
MDGELSYLQFQTADLPQVPAGWFEYGYSVLWNGTLALVRTDVDIWDRIKRHDYTGKRHGRHEPLKLWPCSLRLSVFDGKKERHVTTVRVGGSPTVAMTPDGDWVISISSWNKDVPEGLLVDQRGRTIRQIKFGIGVEHLRCARDGIIWAGYGDVGVYASEYHGKSLVSRGGVVQFSKEGMPLWSLHDENSVRVTCDHCYALTIEGSQAWTYTYSSWSIGSYGSKRCGEWRNRISFADALAVHGDHVVLSGNYGEGPDRLVLLRLMNNRVRVLRTWKLEPRPAGRENSYAQGNGDTLHIVHSGRWRRIKVQELIGLHQAMVELQDAEDSQETARRRLVEDGSGLMVRKKGQGDWKPLLPC